MTLAFRTERDAKEYLIDRILAESERHGVPLADLERKTLYFSETGWTLPDMLEVNAEFEREFDNEEYERKIAGLVREIEKRNQITGGEQQSRWDDAIVKLGEGDHYLLVLIDLGRSAEPGRLSKWLPVFNLYGTGKVRPHRDFLRLIIVGLVLLLVFMAAVVLESWLKNRFGN